MGSGAAGCGRALRGVRVWAEGGALGTGRTLGPEREGLGSGPRKRGGDRGHYRWALGLWGRGGSRETWALGAERGVDVALGRGQGLEGGAGTSRG